MAFELHRLRLVARASDSRDQWQSYEQRKKEIADTARSAVEYERRLRELAEEMRV